MSENDDSEDEDSKKDDSYVRNNQNPNILSNFSGIITLVVHSGILDYDDEMNEIWFI